MNKFVIPVIFGLMGISLHAQSFIENESLNSLNEETVTVNSVPYLFSPVPFSYGRDSEFSRTLNGIWDFAWFPSPEAYSEKNLKFQEIIIPGSWQMSGFGTPIYTNKTYPFNLNPPFIDGINGNPVGVYRKKVAIPEDWQERELFICFEGVSSAFELYVNGRFVGYSEDSYTPSTFDISRYVSPGSTAEIKLKVYRWCDGSYLEDQDGWRFSGIQRDVYIYSVPAVHLNDYTITADAPGNGIGDFKINCEIKNYTFLESDNYSLEATLYDSAGNRIWQNKKNLCLDRDSYILCDFTARLKNIIYWSHETPVLYDVVFQLSGDNGEILEKQRCPVGFRRVEIHGRDILINGKPLIVKGVNRVEHHPLYGKYVPLERMRQEVILMKENNINCVRSAHFPSHPYFYAVCDSLGMYVIDEANVESHGMGYDVDKTLAREPGWNSAHVNRACDMVRRSKNHPCIIIWSLGNEAGCGININSMHNAIKGLDSSRPVGYHFTDEVYKGDIYMGGVIKNGVHNLFARYQSLEDLALISEQATDRPYLLSEFAHGMGNALGNFEEYIDAFRYHDGLVGGCIWDWIDQGLIREISTGRYGYAIENPDEAVETAMIPGSDYELVYGGDFNDTPNDGNFCLNGIVSATMKPTSKLYEVRRVFQNLLFSNFNGEDGSFCIRNEFMFKDISALQYDWALTEDGVEIRHGVFTVPALEYLDTARISIPLNMPKNSNSEYFLNIKVSEMGESGIRTVAEHQFNVLGEYKIPINVTEIKSKIENNGKNILLKSGNLSVAFDTATCYISSLTRNKKLILSDMKARFWRAPTDNDGGGKKLISKKWTALQLDHLEETASIESNGVSLMVRRTFSNNSGRILFTADETYSLGNDCLIFKTTIHASTGLDQIPRIGYEYVIPEPLTSVKWYGAGPFASYSDRNSAADISLYTLPVDNFYESFARPQENGNRSDTRYLKLLSGEKPVLSVYASRPYGFSISNITLENLTTATHSGDLKIEPFRILNLDLAHAPLGNGACGPQPLEKYKVGDGEYQITYIFKL